MKRILLAGGRSPAALELARAFHAAGHEVHVAETTAWCLCSVSRAVARVHRLPWPTRDPDGYVAELVRIVRRERIGLVVPTFEEVFYIAGARERLEAYAEVFCDELEKLDRLHNKWEFIRRVAAHGLAVPRTRLLRGPADLDAALGSARRELVFKPVYSRFSSRVVVRPDDAAELAGVDPSPRCPWVAQEFVPGRALCTYSVAWRGRLTAHGAYPTEFTAGGGTTIVFRSIEHPALLEWVREFVRRENFHGQIAFDFIETDAGALLPLECNPRTTSGVHLFAGRRELPLAFCGPLAETIAPSDGRPSMLALPMLAALRARDRAARTRWRATFAASRDVTYDREDPLPLLMQFFGLGWMYWRSRRYRLPLKQAGIFDLEWDGTAAPKPQPN